MKRVIYFFNFIVIFMIALTACNKKQNHAMYEGEDISKNAKITRNKDTKKATLEIQANGEWKLYAGNNVNNIDLRNPVLKGDGSGTFSIDVNDTARSYFQLVTPEGKAILAETHLPMAGGYNFRDLGGIRNKEGKYVKWGKIFRSDELAKLTPADLQYLASIPINSVVDFRSKAEIKNAPDKLPSTAKYHELNIEPGNIFFDMSFDLDTVDFEGLMMSMNRLFVTDSACIAQYKEFFRLIQQEDDIPLMYHCSAGKDRTGMASALILYALDVDDETIMDNYLLSNEYLGNKYAPIVKEYPMIEPMMVVKPEYLQAGIDQIINDHGSVENFLDKMLDVDIDKMKRMFLYE